MIDWVDWHRSYDDGASDLASRLAVVQACIQEAVARAAGTSHAPRLLAMCAGNGRDVLPVLASHSPWRRVRALLVELDPRLAGEARASARELDLHDVRVVTGDAGTTDAYASIAPADVVLACGVFGNVSTDDVAGTVALLPTMTSPGGTVVWTRGRRDGDPTPPIRAAFAQAGFDEVRFVAPDDRTFSVGVHRLGAEGARPFVPGRRLFTFV